MREDPTRRAVDFVRTWRFAVVLLIPLCLAGLTAASGAEQPRKGPAAVPVEVYLTEYAVAMPDTLSAGPTTFTIRNDGHKTHSCQLYA